MPATSVLLDRNEKMKAGRNERNKMKWKGKQEKANH